LRIALLFTDGVGVGRRAPEVNPLARAQLLLSQFDDGSAAPLPSGGERFLVDATFGVPGRPQSATNQAALFTGLPVPQMVGRHVLGFPDRALRELIARHSVVRRLAHHGVRSTFANGYPAGYLDALGLARRPSRTPDLVIPERARRRLRPSASTAAMAAGQVLLRTLDDVRAGQALTHDLDGERAKARGFEVPGRGASEAAEIFWALAQGHGLTLFEHYLADEAGHARDFDAAQEALGTFDAFAREVVAQRPADALVLVTSDHGNVEDLSTRSHTRNKVPLLAFGPGAGRLGLAQDVAGVGSAVLELLGAAEREVHP
jgi:hypothetical protein